GHGHHLHAVREQRQRPAHQRRPQTGRSAGAADVSVPGAAQRAARHRSARCSGQTGSRPCGRHRPPSPSRLRKVRTVTTTHTYDVVVIGAGPAGQSAAELASFFGHSALVIERTSPGGTVTTTGGAPTKTLREVASAIEADRQHRSAAGLPPIAPDDVLRIARERTLDACRALQGVIARQLDARGITYLKGVARLLPDRGVVIESAAGSRCEVRARTIVLATGSRPVRFAGVPFDDPDVYDSNEIFAMQSLPADIVVAGAG